MCGILDGTQAAHVLHASYWFISPAEVVNYVGQECFTSIITTSYLEIVIETVCGSDGLIERHHHLQITTPNNSKHFSVKKFKKDSMRNICDHSSSLQSKWTFPVYCSCMPRSAGQSQPQQFNAKLVRHDIKLSSMSKLLN